MIKHLLESAYEYIVDYICILKYEYDKKRGKITFRPIKELFNEIK